MMTWRDAMKEAAAGSFTCLADRRMWSKISSGLLAVLQLLCRLLILAAFPLTTPLFAWLLMRHERKAAAHWEEVRARLRADIHRNGRST